jgi:hypothetical protein
LYARRITGIQAAVASIAALIGGALFFPTPAMTSWSGLPANMLYSFAMALILSAVLSLVLNRLPANRQRFDFNRIEQTARE